MPSSNNNTKGNSAAVENLHLRVLSGPAPGSARLSALALEPVPELRYVHLCLRNDLNTKPGNREPRSIAA